MTDRLRILSKAEQQVIEARVMQQCNDDFTAYMAQMTLRFMEQEAPGTADRLVDAWRERINKAVGEIHDGNPDHARLYGVITNEVVRKYASGLVRMAKETK